MAFHNGSYGAYSVPTKYEVLTPEAFKNPDGTSDRFFFDLFSKQAPSGKEHLIRRFLIACLGLSTKTTGIYSEIDKIGNLWVWVGNKLEDGSLRNSKTIFSCHLDTVQRDFFKKDKNKLPRTYLISEQNPSPDKSGFIWAMYKEKDKGELKSCVLGGDDKCGIYIMYHMIKAKIPGLYLFHVGEEVGCEGSGFIAKQNKNILEKYNRAIAFDRKGYQDVIAYQKGERCSSKEFSEALAKQLNTQLMTPNCQFNSDVYGVYTDTASYMEIIPECTNISVGYFGAHSTSECVDAYWLRRMLTPAILKIDWENLPTKRDPKEKPKYTSVHYSWNKKDEYKHNLLPFVPGGKKGDLEDDPNLGGRADFNTNFNPYNFVGDIDGPEFRAKCGVWVYRNLDTVVDIIRQHVKIANIMTPTKKEPKNNSDALGYLFQQTEKLILECTEYFNRKEVVGLIDKDDLTNMTEFLDKANEYANVIICGSRDYDYDSIVIREYFEYAWGLLIELYLEGLMYIYKTYSFADANLLGNKIMDFMDEINYSQLEDNGISHILKVYCDAKSRAN